MGNQPSTANNKNNSAELKSKSVSQILDYIATNYIITMDFKSLKRLFEKEYCDKLVVLTSDIIERYFTDLEITYLAQRVKNGKEVNEIDHDKIIFFDKDNLGKLDIQNSIKKKRICISIAKFYIKIAHVFAAIVTTINPIYVYKDQEGNTVRADLYEKSKIPANTPRAIYKMNICQNRIDALKNNNSTEPDASGNIAVAPKVCSVNVGDNGKTKVFTDEPGIPELEELYYDDNFDENTGKFTGMTKETREVYLQDLQIFYNVFSGNNGPLKAGISKFSDIELRDFHKHPNCQGTDPLFEKPVYGPLSNNLFAKYAENLKNMISKANQNQSALIEFINKLFSYSTDPQTNKRFIRINPKLTEEMLQEIVVEVRALTIKMYLTCEIDYVNGLKLYEAIVDKKIFETTKNQLKNLEKRKDELILDSVPIPAELQQIKEIAQEKVDANEQQIKDNVAKIESEKAVIKNQDLASKEQPITQVVVQQ